MNSSTLRQLWTAVEETQSSTLLKLSDPDLVKQLLNNLANRVSLSDGDVLSLAEYIQAKTTLIRDLAYSRQTR